MKAAHERMALHDKIDRAVRMTVTYLRKSSNALWWTDHRPIPPAYWSLLEQAIQTAIDIVEELPDDYFETTMMPDRFGLNDGADVAFNMSDEPVELTEKLVTALGERRKREKALRRIRQLEEVVGRSPEEAALYLAKAAEMRAKLQP